MDFAIEIWTSLSRLIPNWLYLLLMGTCVVILGCSLVLRFYRRRKGVRLAAAFDERFQPVVTGIQVTEDRSMIISQLALWFELKVQNRRDAALAIKEIYVNYDRSSFEEDRPLGIFRELDGSGVDVKVSNRLRLPLTLEPGEELRAYLLVPIPVSEVLGKLLARTNSDLLFRSEWIRKEVDESIEIMGHSAPGSMSPRHGLGVKSVEVRDPVLKEASGTVEVRPNAGYLPSSAWNRVIHAAETGEESKAVRSLYFSGLTFGIHSVCKRKVEASIPTAQSPFSFAAGARSN